MKTLLLKNTQEDIAKAAEIIKNGGIVGMPTETVYGLAANALDKNAVAGIFRAKGRPADNPLIVHIADVEDIAKYGLTAVLDDEVRLLAEHFWPGPLTIILPKSDNVDYIVTGGLDTVAVRLPRHEAARELIRAAGCPLAAPSANLSGSPSPTGFKHVVDDMYGRIDAIIDGGDSDIGLESTVISLENGKATVLRPGAVTPEDLMCVLSKASFSSAVLEKLKEGECAPSPGMKYKHYAPKAKVFLVKGEDSKYYDFVNSQKNSVALCYSEDKEFISIPTIISGKKTDILQQAHNLFANLRQIDEIKGVSFAYARYPDERGVGMAVLNRLIRAAGFEVINLD